MPELYTEDERRLLRQSAKLQELVEHPGWKELLGIVSQWILHRQALLEAPLGGLPGDFVAKAAHAESVKGAILGMRMVCSLPENTIQDAKSVVAASQEK